MHTTPPRQVIPGNMLDRELCERRGYCGPFINTDFYDSIPDWQGYGDCSKCGTTVQTRLAPPPGLEVA